jgi:hypothetical protein
MSTMTPKEHQELADLLQVYIDTIADLIQAHIDIAAMDTNAPQAQRAEEAVRRAEEQSRELGTIVGRS